MTPSNRSKNSISGLLIAFEKILSEDKTGVARKLYGEI